MAPETDLDAALDGTYAALLAGDLAALGGLSLTLENLADALPGLDRAAADRLRAKADRNGRMLQAAARGVRAARGRLAEISAAPTLTTYDARGRRESVGQVSAAPPRRL
jgi:hypothetical protein